jgi:hypothetical protein
MIMGWSSLASNRYDIKEKAESLASSWENNPTSRIMGFSPILYSLMAGSDDIFNRVFPLTLDLLEKVSRIESDYLATSPAFSDLISLASIAHLEGYDQSEIFHRIAGMKKVKGAINQALQDIVKEFCDSPDKIRDTKYKLGHIHSESAWIKIVTQWPLDHVFNMSICPDHPLWVKVLRHFVLPNALLFIHQNPGIKWKDILSLGAYPHLHQEVLYERSSALPDWDVDVKMDNPSTWRGFDAIEVNNDNLIIYHYLGFTWQAPLVFENDQLNAFAFLEQLDLSWKIVQDNVDVKSWNSIDQSRHELKNVHVVVHDRSVSRYIASHLERASRHYDVSLQAIDITEI